MTPGMVMPGLLGGPGGLRLLGPGYAGRLATLRAGGALAADASGAFRPVAANQPRFQGPAGRLLVEAAGGNAIRNPRMEGAAVGSQLGAGASLPGFWATVISLGLRIGVMDVGSEDGLPCMDLRLYGTPTATGALRLSMEAANVAAAQGQGWTLSCFLRLLAGNLGTSVARTQIVERSGGGGFLTSTTGPAMAPGPGALAGQRSVHQHSVALAATTQVTPEFTLSVEAGVALDVTLRLGAPQLEAGGRATTPVLPPAGQPGVAARAADQPSWTPQGGLGGAGTVLLRALLPATNALADQGLLQLDDGTDGNRLALLNPAGGTALRALAQAGGATLASLALGEMTPGVPFRLGLAWSATGLAACLNGGVVAGATAALPGGLGRLLAGHAAAALDRAANGEIEAIEHRPVRLPDAALQALTAAA